MLSNSKDKRLKDLAGLASLGQLGYRHWECYGWRTGRDGVEEAAQQEFGRLRRREESNSLVYMEYWFNVNWKNTVNILWHSKS